jgi:hypothetical protein
MLINTIKYAILVLCLGGAFIVNAQNKFNVGAVGGANISRIVKHSLKNDRLLGYNFGVILNYNFINVRLGSEMNLLFSQKGGDFGPVISEGGNVLSDEFKVILNYIDLPLVLKWSSINLYGMSWQGGIMYSSLIGGSLNGDELDRTNFNSNDFSVVVGLGVDIERFHFSGRYNFGLMNVYANGSKGNNQGGVISIGFWLKK